MQFSQLSCSDLVLRFAGDATAGPHRSPLGLSDDPGGFPLYRNGVPIARGLLSVPIDYDVDNDLTSPFLMQYTLQGTVPANAVAVRVFVRNQGHNTLNFDAACLTK